MSGKYHQYRFSYLSLLFQTKYVQQILTSIFSTIIQSSTVGNFSGEQKEAKTRSDVACKVLMCF
jgi:hypothetical protein